MYVVRDDDNNDLYPADRVVFRSTYSEANGQYEISNAVFHGATSTTNITNATLGFVGKSGRFVPISGS